MEHGPEQLEVEPGEMLDPGSGNTIELPLTVYSRSQPKSLIIHDRLELDKYIKELKAKAEYVRLINTFSTREIDIAPLLQASIKQGYHHPHERLLQDITLKKYPVKHWNRRGIIKLMTAGSTQIVSNTWSGSNPRDGKKSIDWRKFQSLYDGPFVEAYLKDGAQVSLTRGEIEARTLLWFGEILHFIAHDMRLESILSTHVEMQWEIAGGNQEVAPQEDTNVPRLLTTLAGLLKGRYLDTVREFLEAGEKDTEQSAIVALAPTEWSHLFLNPDDVPLDFDYYISSQ